MKHLHNWFYNNEIIPLIAEEIQPCQIHFPNIATAVLEQGMTSVGRGAHNRSGVTLAWEEGIPQP